MQPVHGSRIRTDRAISSFAVSAAHHLRSLDDQRHAARKSLGTTDKAKAEILALPYIQQHKLDLWRHREIVPRKFGVKFEKLRYPVGDSVRDDGVHVVATNETAILIKDGKTVAIEDNRQLEIYDIKNLTDDEVSAEMAKSKGSKSDFSVLDDYLNLKARNKYYTREARHTWEQFQAFVDGRPIKDWARKDAVGFVKLLRDRGDKTATIVKKINYLSAPIGHAILHDTLTKNPFFKCVDSVNDGLKRLSLDENDMALFREKAFPRLASEEILLWSICASTGMRHSEAYGISEEFLENGIRYVRVGQKTETSDRRVPLPDALLPLLPQEIEGPLFTNSLKNLSKNLLRALRRVGITDPRKVVYSLRHRAHDRLRACECPLDIQHHIAGHEEVTAHRGYGHGYAMYVLKPWVEKIGL